MGKTLIRTVALKKSFKKGGLEIPVLKGVDLEIKEGETLAITGPSGVGKSTLLHILGTLEEPTSGSVFYQDKDVFKWSDTVISLFRNRELGFIFQFHHLLPEFTALENVMMPALIGGLSRAKAEPSARSLLKFVGLEHRLSHRPSELSGGEQQRVAIARSIALKPKLLLADEATGNLDTANSQMVMDLLVRLNRETGIAVALVTHDLGLASKMQRVITMRDGVFISENR